MRACVRGEAKRREGVGTVVSGAGPGGAKISFSFAPLPFIFSKENGFPDPEKR